MNGTVHRFTFRRSSDAPEAESTLHLAIFAAEGLFGEARVRLEASYTLDTDRNLISVDGATEVGCAIVRIFTALLLREIGPEAFEVRSIASPPPVPEEQAA